MALSKITNASVADTAVHGRRNLIINGAMQVAQRGTSATGKTSAGYHAVDRYNSAINTAGTWTVSQDTSAPDGFRYSQKYECTTADSSLTAGDYLIHQTRLEGQDLQQFKFGTSSAKAMTISFWVKSSKTGTYTCEVMHVTTGGAYPAAGKTYSISSADTWEYKTITLSGDTTNDIRNTNTIGVYLNMWLAVGSNFSSGTFNDGSWTTTTANRISSSNVNLADTVGNTWQITGVQLEVGDTATPFEHRSYGEEFQLCQRYYQLIGTQDGEYFLNDLPYNHHNRFSVPYLPVEMRATPTGTFYNWDTGTTGQVREFSTGTARTVSAWHGEGKRGGGYAQLSASATDNIVLTMRFDAEL